MSVFRVLSELDDLIDDPSTVIGNAMGEQAGFPVDNIETSDITELWVSAGASGGFNSTMSFELAQSPPTSWDLFVIINHNIPSTATVTLKSGTTGAVSDHSDVITWRAGDMYILLETPRTDAFFQLLIVDASMPDGDTISAGRMMIGASAAASHPFQNDWTRTLQTHVRESRSDLGTKSVDVIYRCFDFSFDFANMSDADRNTFIAWLWQHQGPKYWFFLIPETTDYSGYVVRMTNQPGETLRKYGTDASRRSTLSTLTLEEESRGVRLGL